jgi:hypothetical protein
MYILFVYTCFLQIELARKLRDNYMIRHQDLDGKVSWSLDKKKWITDVFNRFYKKQGLPKNSTTRKGEQKVSI